MPLDSTPSDSAKVRTKRDAAIYLAQRGFYVFPLRAGGKLPMAKGWKDSASCHLADVFDNWLAKDGSSENFNIGVVGRNCVILDVDIPSEAHTVDGRAALAKFGWTGRTFTTRTPSGGLHLYFKKPAGRDYKQSDLAPGINVRSTGGYALGPGSWLRYIKGRQNEGTYKIIDDSPLAELPANIENFLTPAGAHGHYDESSYRGEWDFPADVAWCWQYIRGDAPAAVKGNRGRTGLVLAHVLGDRAISADLALEMLREWHELQCTPNVDDTNQMESVLASAYSNRECEFGRHAINNCFEPIDVEASLAELRAQGFLTTRYVLRPNDPMPSARHMRATRFTADEKPTLYHHQSEFLCWKGTHYIPADDNMVRAAIWDHLESAHKRVKSEKNGALTEVPFSPTSPNVSNVLDALKGLTNLSSQTELPAWVGTDPARPPAAEFMPCANGLLHLKTRRLWKATPEFVGLNALPYEYVEDAPPPVEWIKFLVSVWGDDAEAIGCLQESFGLCLTTDTRYHKMLLVIGPPRSGKGTIARVLRALVGPANCAGPTLNSLGRTFGLQALIGKQLAIISDARLDAANNATIAERLLAISGEDAIDIDRKHIGAWSGRLPTRFMAMTNELPKLTDESGALASRFILLQMHKSFLGQEDQGLEARLLEELPSILLWALEGLDRLTARGSFVMPASSSDVAQALDDLSSPIRKFIREACEVGSERSVCIHELYEGYQRWQQLQGRDYLDTKSTFATKLRAALPALKDRRPRDNQSDERKREYVGIALKREYGRQPTPSYF